jgi:hypothetical protein
MPLGLWSLIYSSILIINSLAILSNQRFLLPLGLSSSSTSTSSYDDYNNNNDSIKHKIIHLVSAVRTLMRSKFIHYHFTILYSLTITTTNSTTHSN